MIELKTQERVSFIHGSHPYDFDVQNRMKYIVFSIICELDAKHS